MEPTERTLKILAEQLGDGGLKFYGMEERQSEEYFRKLSKIVRYSGNWWYLHGDLQVKVGYDKGFILNIEPEDMNDSKTDIALEGIYPVEVVGITEPCIGYFWVTKTSSMGRGLVCLEADKQGRKEAKKHYLEKSEIL